MVRDPPSPMCSTVFLYKVRVWRLRRAEKYLPKSRGRSCTGYFTPMYTPRQCHNEWTYPRRRALDPERTTSFIHRRYLYSRMNAEEKRRLWQGPVHQVATKAHAIRVGCPSSSVGISSRIFSKNSGGKVADAFGTGGLGLWGQPFIRFTVVEGNRRRLTNIHRRNYGVDFAEGLTVRVGRDRRRQSSLFLLNSFGRSRQRPPTQRRIPLAN